MELGPFIFDDNTIEHIPVDFQPPSQHFHDPPNVCEQVDKKANMGRQNLTYYLAERPTGNIVHGKTFRQEKTEAPTADQLKDGEVLVEALYMSLDPAMRGWLNGMWPLLS